MDGLLALLACMLGHHTVVLAASSNDNGLLWDKLDAGRLLPVEAGEDCRTASLLAAASPINASTAVPAVQPQVQANDATEDRSQRLSATTH